MTNIQITCPNCKHHFSAEQAISGDLEKEIATRLKAELNQQSADWKKKQEAEWHSKLQQLEEQAKQQRQHDEQLLNQKTTQLAEQIRQKIEAENQEILTKLIADNQAQTQKIANLKNLELQIQEKNNLIAQEKQRTELIQAQAQRQLQQQKEEMQLTMQKHQLELQTELEEKIRQKETEKNELRFKEYEKQFADQQRLIEEMKRKAEQVSMQLQGEVQELAIEEWILSKFPHDQLDERKKGARGGDCIQIVLTPAGNICGKIYYESKRTKEFSPSWIEKFKEDMRAIGADIGVIVTQTMPKDMPRFGERDGLWICTYDEFKGLSYVLRDSLIRLNNAKLVQANKGDKMSVLYDYLTSAEFRMSVESIVEGFSAMQDGLNREKRAMQKIWKEREKQIEKVINSTIGMYGSVKGIAGSAIQDIQLLELETDTPDPDE
jgi:hypothetical protein